MYYRLKKLTLILTWFKINIKSFTYTLRYIAVDLLFIFYIRKYWGFKDGSDLMRCMDVVKAKLSGRTPDRCELIYRANSQTEITFGPPKLCIPLKASNVQVLVKIKCNTSATLSLIDFVNIMWYLLCLCFNKKFFTIKSI